MYNPFKPAILFAALFCLMVPAAHADSPAEVKKTLQGIYHAQDAALNRKDVEAFFDPIDLDAKFISPKGQVVSYSKYRYTIEEVFILPIGKISSTTNILSCNVKGETATVVVKARVTLTARNQNTQKISTLVIADTSRDYWENSDAGWHLKQSRTLTETGTINGKRIKRK